MCSPFNGFLYCYETDFIFTLIKYFWPSLHQIKFIAKYFYSKHKFWIPTWTDATLFWQGYDISLINFQIPKTDDHVTISTAILLDTDVPELFSITIVNGGRLVFSPDRDHALRVHYILIENGGEMHIGAEDCQFEKSVTITLLGKTFVDHVTWWCEHYIYREKHTLCETFVEHVVKILVYQPRSYSICGFLEIMLFM